MHIINNYIYIVIYIYTILYDKHLSHSTPILVDWFEGVILAYTMLYDINPRHSTNTLVDLLIGSRELCWLIGDYINPW